MTPHDDCPPPAPDVVDATMRRAVAGHDRAVDATVDAGASLAALRRRLRDPAAPGPEPASGPPALLTTVRRRSDRARARRSTPRRGWWSATVGTAVYAAAGAVAAVPGWDTAVTVVLFLLVPAAAVTRWFLLPRYGLDDREDRDARRMVGACATVEDQSVLLARHCAVVGSLGERVGALDRRVRSRIEAPAVGHGRDDLALRLELAHDAATSLSHLLRAAARDTAAFARSARHDAVEACLEHAMLAPDIDPARVSSRLHRLASALRQASSLATGLALATELDGDERARPDGDLVELVADVVDLGRDALVALDQVDHECRITLRATDALHRLVTTESIDSLPARPLDRRCARAAVAVAVAGAAGRRRARRPAVRRQFVDVATRAAPTGRRWVVPALTAAVAGSPSRRGGHAVDERGRSATARSGADDTRHEEEP